MKKFNVKLIDNKYSNGIIAQVKELRSLFSCPHLNRVLASLTWTKNVCDQMRASGEVTICLSPEDLAVFLYNLGNTVTMEFDVGPITIPEPTPTIFTFERSDLI
jgi:hypothetical protein